MNRIRMMNKKYVEKLRNELAKELYNYCGTEKIKFDLTKEELEDIIFEYENPNKKKISFEFRIIKKLDLSDVDFTNVDISGVDFTESKGVKINPQTIADKNLESVVAQDVEFIGPFDEVRLTNTNFTGSKRVRIEEETAKKITDSCNLTDVEIYSNEKIYEEIHKTLIKSLRRK